MDILPPSKPGDRIHAARPPIRTVLRPIYSEASAVKKDSGPVILPSIRSSHGTISHVGSSGVEIKGLPMLAGSATTQDKKKGRPSKAEKMKEKKARASERIKELVDKDPTKADVHKYFEARIKELLDEC